MRSSPTVVRAAAALLLLLVSRTPAHANCGAENCPLNPQGLESSDRSWSFDLGYQYIPQDRHWNLDHEDNQPAAIGHITELYTRTHSWTLNWRGQLLPSLRINATLPYVQREHAHEQQHHTNFFLVSRWKYEGLGDASVQSQWTAFGTPRQGLGAVSLLSGVKLPTGRTSVPEVTPVGQVGSLIIEGEPDRPESPARPGTGSTDFLAGVQVVRSIEVPSPGGLHSNLPIALSVLGRYNGKGTDDYRSGREMHASLSSGYGLGHRLMLLAQVNLTAHGRDDVGQSDAEPHHTGGMSVFATPGLRFGLPNGAALYGYWQARVYEHTNGPQLVAPSHVIVGASFGLGR
jgi:hypothetical protein